MNVSIKGKKMQGGLTLDEVFAKLKAKPGKIMLVWETDDEVVAFTCASLAELRELLEYGEARTKH